MLTLPPKPSELSEEQFQVAQLIANGEPVAEAARVAGVPLLTVFEWRYHQAFVNWLRIARESRIEFARNRIAGLLDEAVQTLQHMLSAEHEPTALKAAVEILRLNGVEPETNPTEGEQQRKRANATILVHWIASRLDDPQAREAVLRLTEGI